MSKLGRYLRMFAHWTKMLLGSSYYHLPQGLGRAFVPGRLEGYFNDLTVKTKWKGSIDEEGIPINLREDGSIVYFTTTVVQKALGHWDKWLLSHDVKEKEAFLMICNWLVKNQDKQGGWPLWSQVKLSLPSPYSAMTQGESVSALVRAWYLTRDEIYLSAARRALRLMFVPVEKGGIVRRLPDGVILEEIPSWHLSGILNGWIFALFGLYDFLLVEKDLEAHKLLEDSLQTLITYLPRYNAGYWSFYDLQGNLASPFYQRLHIAQLEALELAFPEHAEVFCRYRYEFSRQMTSWINCGRAIVVKAWQKLKNPPEVVLK
ncbi:MAG TPA: thioredoxin [Thermococcus sp.]|nr:thioredoxin [Thermococcus sp.]